VIGPTGVVGWGRRRSDWLPRAAALGLRELLDAEWSPISLGRATVLRPVLSSRWHLPRAHVTAQAADRADGKTCSSTG
jgi:hypothetical protein